MSYSDPVVKFKQSFGLFDFGGGASATFKLSVPAGCSRGYLHEIGVENITEVFAVDTATGKVQVGKTGTATAYGNLQVPDGTAVTDVIRGNHEGEGDDADAITQPEINLGDLTDDILLVTLVNGTDGSAVTGQGYPYVIVSFW